ncbi:flavodoxin family protein [Methanofollis sp. W23]|uniref:flavodoxin family protein n=1 Tax=Methanofollis sp. W23 TaxID=2817849 RepID=UPI001AE789F9|nr:flavodoxin family protein [Methanofollis sp. W23]
MRILGINGSPRGPASRTRRLVEGVLGGAATAGAETEYIDIAAYTIRPCVGCTLCYQTGECPKMDDFLKVYEKMLDADGIVLGSPNYINNVSAQLKLLLDRMADAIHCQRFVGKYGCAVSTAGGSGAEDVAAYLNQTLRVLGATTIGAVGVDLGTESDALSAGGERAHRLGTDLVAAIGERRKYPDQETFHQEMEAHMRALVEANKETWRHEYDTWAARPRT